MIAATVTAKKMMGWNPAPTGIDCFKTPKEIALKCKSGADMMNPMKQICQYLTRSFTLVPDFEVPTGCKFAETSDNLSKIWLLCRHFLA